MMIHGPRMYSLLAVIAVFAATVLVGAAVYATSPPAWTKFDSESKNFSVFMPGRPDSTELHNKTFVGDITTSVFTAHEDKDTYVVDYTPLPGFAVFFSGKDGIYNHAKAAILGKTYSKVISYTDVTLNGVQGKKLVYDTPSKPDHPEMQGEARIFLFGDNLYTADAVVVMKGSDEKIDRFFSSLEIEK